MIGKQQRRFISGGPWSFAPAIQAVLVQLAEAHDYARDVQCDPWQYAVEVQGLVAEGLTASELRELVGSGFVEHGREITSPDDPSRRFESAGNVRFSTSSCFVVTDAGLQLTMREPARPAMRHAA